jgi:hypothetical protein
MLLERPGEVLTRDELQKNLWPANTFVDFERSLNAAVKRLRAALNDSADQPRYIETLARRGYRFIAPVTLADAENGAVAPGSVTRPPVAPPPPAPTRNLWLIALAVCGLAAVGLGWQQWRHRIHAAAAPAFIRWRCFRCKT